MACQEVPLGMACARMFGAFGSDTARERIHGFSIHASSATKTVMMKAPTMTAAATAPRRPSHRSDGALCPKRFRHVAIPSNLLHYADAPWG